MVKMLKCLASGGLVVLIVSSFGSLFAQTKAKTPLPQVPITYPGDTDETIKRRAQWIEGAKKEAALAWWGPSLSPQAKGLIDEFNKIYPFIEVSYWKGASGETPVRVEAELAAGRLGADVVTLGEGEVIPKWRKMGIMTKFIDLLPRPERLDKRTYSKYGDWAIYAMNVYAPQYNTNLVAASEAPKSWEDLLAPRWIGKIGITRTPGAWIALATAEGGWGWTKTEEFLRKLRAQKMKIGMGGMGTHSLLVAGEYHLVAQGFLAHVIRSQKKKAPVDWCKINNPVVEGSPSVLMSKAPHPNAARLFMEWIFSPPGLVAVDRITDQGLPFAGAGTLQSKLVGNLNLIVGGEDSFQSSEESDRVRVFNALGISGEAGSKQE